MNTARWWMANGCPPRGPGKACPTRSEEHTSELLSLPPRRSADLGGDRWVRETVLRRGTCEYCLMVDGEWMPDPRARESVPNLFGGRNSLLKVASSPEAAHLADAENLPLKNANK